MDDQHVRKSRLLAKIDTAERQIASAEDEVAAAIRELRVMSRAEKMISSQAIERALDGMGRARLSAAHRRKPYIVLTPLRLAVHRSRTRRNGRAAKPRPCQAP
jgi:multidrug resistance efflux pump